MPPSLIMHPRKESTAIPTLSPPVPPLHPHPLGAGRAHRRHRAQAPLVRALPLVHLQVSPCGFKGFTCGLN